MEVGPACRSLSFDGVNDFVVVPDDPDLRLASSDYTIEYWVKIPTSGGGAVVSKRASSSGYTTGIYPFGYSIKNTGATGATASNQTYDYSKSLSGWTHVAITHDKSSLTTKVYLDGVLDKTSTTMTSLVGNSLDLWIGRERINTTQYINATFGGIRLSTAVEYSGTFVPEWPLPESTQTLARWSMTDGSTSLSDSSGGGHDGTINGAAWVDDCP